jgi:hypothetical protein
MTGEQKVPKEGIKQHVMWDIRFSCAKLQLESSPEALT